MPAIISIMNVGAYYFTDICKEIVFQCNGNAKQQIRVDIRLAEDLVNVLSITGYSFGKIHHSHPILFEFFLNHFAYMHSLKQKIVYLGHLLKEFINKKVWGRFRLFPPNALDCVKQG